jgi:hypothetical protein
MKGDGLPSSLILWKDATGQLERPARARGSPGRDAAAEPTMPYFTNAGPKSGPILWRDGDGAIDVFRDPDDRTPIGTAQPVGGTEGGIVIWDIFIRGAAVPGRWIVLGRQFLLKR